MHSDFPNTLYNSQHISNPWAGVGSSNVSCVARNIFPEFQSTGIFPNSEIFCDDNFSSSAVSDRDPGVSQMVTSVENSEQLVETQITQGVSVSVAVATEKDMPGTSAASKESNDHETTLNSTDLTTCSSKTSFLQMTHLYHFT